MGLGFYLQHYMCDIDTTWSVPLFTLYDSFSAFDTIFTVLRLTKCNCYNVMFLSFCLWNYVVLFLFCFRRGRWRSIHTVKFTREGDEWPSSEVSLERHSPSLRRLSVCGWNSESPMCLVKKGVFFRRHSGTETLVTSKGWVDTWDRRVNCGKCQVTYRVKFDISIVCFGLFLYCPYLNSILITNLFFN